MFNFFIDTADTQYIKKIKSTFGGEGIFSNLKGITTNPNAMSKINRHSLREWEEILPTLCELVSEMRQDDKGEVHIQAPSSAMTGDAVLSFAQHIHSFTDGNTKLALKIPPSLTVLKKTPEIQQIMPVNVTGLADCSTALSCLLYNVDYVSIIPGRMEEAGINADEHLLYLTRRNNRGEIITGSMRTLDGLIRAILAATTPTIGVRVWDKIIEEELNLKTLEEKDYLAEFQLQETTPLAFSPRVSDKNMSLSISFFDEMDALGEKSYEEFCLL